MKKLFCIALLAMTPANCQDQRDNYHPQQEAEHALEEALAQHDTTWQEFLGFADLVNPYGELEGLLIDIAVEYPWAVDPDRWNEDWQQCQAASDLTAADEGDEDCLGYLMVQADFAFDQAETALSVADDDADYELAADLLGISADEFSTIGLMVDSAAAEPESDYEYWSAVWYEAYCDGYGGDYYE